MKKEAAVDGNRQKKTRWFVLHTRPLEFLFLLFSFFLCLRAMTRSNEYFQNIFFLSFTYSALIELDFPLGEIGHVFERVDRDEDRPDVRLYVVTHDY